MAAARKAKAKRKKMPARKPAARKKAAPVKKKVARRKPVVRPAVPEKKPVVSRGAPEKKPVVQRPAPKKKPVARPAPEPKARPATPPPQRAAAATPATAAAPAAAEERVGIVTHYFSHISVAVVRMESGSLRLGDTIHVSGHTSDFRQRVESMEIEHKLVSEAVGGQEFGLKVTEHAREHDVVSKVST